jgi:hypothetical protein
MIDHDDFNERTIRAGLPAMRESSGTSDVTTLPAATTERLPMRTPFIIKLFIPIQQSSPISTGEAGIG